MSAINLNQHWNFQRWIDKGIMIFKKYFSYLVRTVFFSEASAAYIKESNQEIYERKELQPEAVVGCTPNPCQLLLVTVGTQTW